MVITSHDPLRWNFSDSTDLSEALLIATRRSESDQPAEHRSTFVNLWRDPNGVLPAHRIAGAIAATAPARLEDTGTALLEVDGQHVGEMVSLPETKLVRRQWSGVQFARADLLRSALRLLDDGQVWVPGEANVTHVPLCSVGEIGQVGPDRRDVWDGFEVTGATTAYPIVMNHDTLRRKRLVASPDQHLAPLVKPRPGRRLKPLDQLWSKSGRLLVSERLRLNTARIVAMRSEMNVLSNVWWPVRIKDERMEKALTAWLNSSLGLLTMVAQRTSTEGSWVALKKADLEKLPVLNVNRISPTQLQNISYPLRRNDRRGVPPPPRHASLPRPPPPRRIPRQSPRPPQPNHPPPPTSHRTHHLQPPPLTPRAAPVCLSQHSAS